MRSLSVLRTAVSILAVALAFSVLGVTESDSPAIERISVTQDGSAPGKASGGANYISDDGKYVLFNSQANNIVPNDTNPHQNVFLRDREAGTTELISPPINGGPFTGEVLGMITPDLRWILITTPSSNFWAGDTNGESDVFLYDRQTETLELVSEGVTGNTGDERSYGTGISDDGRYVTFFSWASDILPGDTNGYIDAFVRDMQSGVTSMVSVAAGGTQGNGDSYSRGISNDGRYVTLTSDASNFVGGDTNDDRDAFLVDRVTGVVTRVSLAPGGGEYTTDSYSEELTSNGRYVLYFAGGGAWVYDRITGFRILASVASDGTPANSSVSNGDITDDGRYVVFNSGADNLDPGDTNGEWDVFRRDLQTETTIRVSSTASGEPIEDVWSSSGRISDNGAYVSFSTSACVTDGPTGEKTNIYVRNILEEPTAPPNGDSECDGVHDTVDNCPDGYNENQADADGDGLGDVCDPIPYFDPYDVRIDAEDGATPANAHNFVGSVDICARVDANGIQDADEDGIDLITVDVVIPAPGILAATGISGFQVSVGFDGSRASIVEYDIAQMISGGGPNVIDLSYSGGSSTFVASAVDLGAQYEYGPGSLAKLTIAITGSDPGLMPISLTGVSVSNKDGVASYPQAIAGATLALNTECGTTDSDGDGILDAVDNCLTANPDQANADADAWGDNCDECPATATEWVVSQGDTDCDGFADSAEFMITTDAVVACGHVNPMAPSPNWPADIVPSDSVNISDVLALKSVFGSGGVPPRLDLVPSGSVNVSDVLALKAVFGGSCTP